MDEPTRLLNGFTYYLNFKGNRNIALIPRKNIKVMIDKTVLFC